MKSCHTKIWRMVLLIFFWLVLVATCPERCICKWKNGKQNVECVGKKYNSIPKHMDPGSQVLDFSDNNLLVLSNNTFEALGLINLQKIYLVRCKLSKISVFSFRGLKNLVELDLSQNYITTVPTPIFTDCPSLMRLLLNENPIKTIPKHAFRHLSFLSTLEISSAEISMIEDEAFMGLNNLEWLKLDNNKITTIKGNNILPESLHGIDLHNNKWQCDCHLRDLHNWISTFSTPHLNEPLCYTPKRFNGKPIKSLSEIDLACLIDVLPSKLYIEINEGQNISLQCIVNAIPEANITWWFQGQNLEGDLNSLQGIASYKIEEEGTFKKRSELFIYNTNFDVNGTYECIGENPAGKSQANYTIKVLAKEEPVVIEVKFPYEYIIPLITGGGALALIILISILIAIIKCKRKKKKEGLKKRVQNSNDNSAKTTFASCLSIAPSKIDGNAFTNGPSHHVLFCQINANNDLSSDNIDRNLYLQGADMNFSTDNNPDLINHADNKEKCKICGQDCQNMCSLALINFDANPLQMLPNVHHRQVKWIDQQNCAINTRSFSPSFPNDSQAAIDIHNKSFHDNDGYPLDYGLPKIETIQRSLMLSKGNSVFYRTLPHKSTLKKPTLHRNGFSNEAEMYNGPKQNISYNIHNPLEKRYTMEGYPFVQPKLPPNLELPNLNHVSKVDFVNSDQSHMLPRSCLYQDATTHISANELKIGGNKCLNCISKGNSIDTVSEKSTGTRSKYQQILTRCVPTQTEPEHDIHCQNKDGSKMYGIVKKTGVSIESSDEGYVGDVIELKDS